MKTQSVWVRVYYYGGTYIARAGEGSTAKTASATSSVHTAVTRAADKWFAQFDDRDRDRSAEIQLRKLEALTAAGRDVYEASLPETQEESA